MTKRRIVVQWTDNAKRALAQLPLKARRGLLAKARTLEKAFDPKATSKPLVGPLQGYYRIVYGRYRAIYSVQEELKKDGEIIVCIRIRFVIAGIRKEGDKKDIYRLALKLLELGLLDETAAEDQKGT